MEIGQIFEHLQIQETKDKDAIKAAYRRLLPKTNPEDDPEGFKVLRQAYEEAMRYADRPEEKQMSAVEQDDSPVGLWIRQADQIYQCFSKRVDLEQWKALLQDDICQALDLADEVEKKFLIFLMSHFRMPQEVWKLLDQEFHIVERKQQLMEIFPKEYIQFLCYEIQHGGFFDFHLFEGPEEGDYDTYINQYLQTKQLMDGGIFPGMGKDYTPEEMREQARQLLEQLEAMDMYHPYADVERLRLAIQEDKREEVQERLQMLSWGDAAQNPYVLSQMGAAHEYLEEMEQAKEIYSRLLAQQKGHFTAGLGMLHCEMKEGKWVQAKERLLDLLEMAKNDPNLVECMHQCNASLMPQYRTDLEKDPADWHARIELGWCLFQEERIQECIELIREVEWPEEERIEYCNMLSRAYLMRKEYAKSLPLLKEWQERMYALPDSDDPKIKKKKRRLGYSYYAVAFCMQELGQGQEAVAHYDKAVELETDEEMLQSYLMGKAHMLCSILHRYEESAQVCDQLLERNEQFMPAYVCRQECSYRMGRAQAVLQDYQQAISIYPVYLPPYLMAAKVFYYFGQYANALEIIEKARELDLTSTELDFLEARVLRHMAKVEDELDRPKELLQDVLTQLRKKAQAKKEREASGGILDEEPTIGEDPVEEADVWKELAFCCMDEKDWEQAMDMIRQGLEVFPENEGLIYAKAGTLKGMGRPQEAEPLYRQLLRKQPDHLGVLNQLLDCLEDTDRDEEVERLCQEILALDPLHVPALAKLMHLYQEKMKQLRQPQWFGPAKELADRLISRRPDAYFYIERGLLLSDQYLLEEALADYQKAMELEPDNLYAYNNAGVNSRHLDRWEDALAYGQKSVQCMGDRSESILPWKNLAILYMVLGRLEEAWVAVAENEKRFPGRNSFYMDRAEILERWGRLDEAIAQYEHFLKSKDPMARRAMVNLANVHAMKGDLRQAQKCWKQCLKEFPGDVWVELQCIDFMLEYQVDLRTAYSVLKTRLQDPSKDTKETVYTLVQMVQVCYYLKKTKERDMYYQRAVQLLSQCGPLGEEDYVGLEPAAPSYRYHLGLLHLYGGQWELAEAHFLRMQQHHRCEFCHYGKCYESIRGLALVRWMQGRFEEAKELFRTVLEINPHCGVSQYYLTKAKPKKR